MAEVTSIDLKSRQVALRVAVTGETEVLEYDHLVLALGSQTRLPDVPGIGRHAVEIKGLRDAILLRDRAIEQLEAADASSNPDLRAALLHWVIVGGNYTGVEAAGEFEVFLRAAARRYPNLDPREVRLTLIEIAERILPALDPKLSDYAARALRRRGIDVRTRTTVAALEPERVRLADGTEIPARTVIWCAGIAPNSVAAGTEGLPRDDRGYVRCESDLRVASYDHVWGIGDGAAIPDGTGRPYPATAQHAVREGVACAENLMRVLRGEATHPFVYRTVGIIAALGCRTGVARLFNVQLSGFAAWFVFRSVYLLKMPGWSRRARVALDWTVDLFFPREFVQLGMAEGSERSREHASGEATLGPPEIFETRGR